MTTSSRRQALFGLDSDARVEALKDFLDIEDLLLELNFQRVSRRGGEVWAACPFHDDRKTHWSINVDLDSDRWGLHSCFVCRESGVGTGNVVSLVRDLLDKQDYVEALVWLEEFAGIKYTEDFVLELALRKRMARTTGLSNPDGEEDPAMLFSRMRPVSAGSSGWNYLVGRGVSPRQITNRDVRVGQHRYRNRVVFPIHSSGDVVNFYARSIGDQEPKGLYARKKGTISTTLWGLDTANKLRDICYIVEGVFDVLTGERLLRPFNVPESANFFATNGAMLHEDQARLLQPFKTVIVVPDMKGNAKSLVPSSKKYLKDHELLLVEPPTGYDLDDWGRDDPGGAADALLSPKPLYKTKVITIVDYSIRR